MNTRANTLAARPRTLATRGFTLLEVLAALALLSLLMVAVWSGITTATDTVVRGRKHVQRLDQVRGAQRFLRHNLAQATAIPYATDDNNRLLVFQGQVDSMRLVAPLPGFLGRMGPQWQKLELVPDEDGDKRLQITFARLSPDGSEMTPIDKPEVLLTGIRKGHFSYRGRDVRNRDMGWQTQWSRPSHTPALVRIDLQLDNGSWPTLTVPVRVDQSAVNRSGLRTPQGIGDAP